MSWRMGADAVDSRAATMCPVVRDCMQRWEPEHDQEAQSGVLVARSGKGKNYHYFPQCGALQWGHCAVSVHEARAQDCAECLQCRRQRQQGSWCERTGFPQREWRRQTPAGISIFALELSFCSPASSRSSSSLLALGQKSATAAPLFHPDGFTSHPLYAIS